MKKTLLLLLVAMSVCLGGFAQKGRQAVGVDVPFRVDFDARISLGIGLKYQYNLTDYICLEPAIQGSFIPEDEDRMTFSSVINSKFFFTSPNRFRPYGVIGLGFGIYKEYDWDYYYTYDNPGFLLKAGLGLDYRLSYDWSWQLECNFETLYFEFSEIYISTGITYNF